MLPCDSVKYHNSDVPESKRFVSSILWHTFSSAGVLRTQLPCVSCFLQERDKLILTRTVIYELVNVLRFKSLVPDENLLMMVQVRIKVVRDE